MRDYFLSRVFSPDDGAGAGNPPEPPAGGGGNPPGDHSADPPAGTPPKPPKQRSDAEVFQDRTAQLTRQKGEAVARAEKAERELKAAQELLARQATPPRDENDDPADNPPAQPRAPAAPPRRAAPAHVPTLDEILESEDGKKALDRRATEIASQKEFTRRGDDLYDKAVEQFGAAKVDKALSNFKAFDGLRQDLAEAIFDLDNGPAVLVEIASKPGLIEQLYGMKPAAMGARIAALATTVKVGKQSRAPEPPEDIGGGRGGQRRDTSTDDNTDMATWVRNREADLKQRGVRL